MLVVRKYERSHILQRRAPLGKGSLTTTKYIRIYEQFEILRVKRSNLKGPCHLIRQSTVKNKSFCKYEQTQDLF